MSKKIRYDDYFKAGAVELAQTSEKPVVQIAEELGIKPSLLALQLAKENTPAGIGESCHGPSATTRKRNYPVKKGTEVD